MLRSVFQLLRKWTKKSLQYCPNDTLASRIQSTTYSRMSQAVIGRLNNYACEAQSLKAFINEHKQGAQSFMQCIYKLIYSTWINMWNGRPILSVFNRLNICPMYDCFYCLTTRCFGQTHIWPKSVDQSCKYLFYSALVFMIKRLLRLI